MKGEKQIKHTDEQKREIVERVCELYETQNATVESCCEAAGISDRLFRLWLGQNSELSERYKKAKAKQDDVYWDMLRPLAKTSLQRLLEGEETEDVELKDLSFQGFLTNQKAKTVKRSKTQPNPTAVIFALKGLYPDMFADRSLVNMKVESVEHETLSAEMLDEIDRHLVAKKTDEGTVIPGKSKGQR